MSSFPEKYRAIIEKHAPKGWKVLWMRPHTASGGFIYGEIGACKGVADFSNRVIACVPIEDRYALAVYLHECGHVNLGHAQDCETEEYAQTEYEAEKYAIDALRAAGVPVPRKYLQSARAYVDYCVRKRPEVQHTDEVLKFAYGRKWKEHQ